MRSIKTLRKIRRHLQPYACRRRKGVHTGTTRSETVRSGDIPIRGDMGEGAYFPRAALPFCTSCPPLQETKVTPSLNDETGVRMINVQPGTWIPCGNLLSTTKR